MADMRHRPRSGGDSGGNSGAGSPRSAKESTESTKPDPRSEFESSMQCVAAVRFTVEPRAMGARTGFDLDDVGGLLEILDGPAHR